MNFITIKKDFDFWNSEYIKDNLLAIPLDIFEKIQNTLSQEDLERIKNVQARVQNYQGAAHIRELQLQGLPSKPPA